LSGQEAAAILGPEDVLTDGNRQNAIAALARAKRFGPSIGEDAALALKGATHASRAAAVVELAPYLQSGLPSQAAAAILGEPLVQTYGWGGVSAVSDATGMSRNTIRKGMAELELRKEETEGCGGDSPAQGRWRPQMPDRD
jgi:hypothetical protein